MTEKRNQKEAKNSKEDVTIQKNDNFPLGWTRVRRKRKRPEKSNRNNNANEKEQDYVDRECEEQNCIDCFPKAQMDTILSDASNRHLREKNGEDTVVWTGKGIFCLHTVDCSWFQGYFIPTSANASVPQKRPPIMGILSILRTDTDECLHCMDGGYRELDVTFFPPKAKSRQHKDSNSINKNSKADDTIQLEKVICTGGDMLHMTTVDRNYQNVNGDKDIHLTYQAEKVITGKEVDSYVKRFFSSLIRKIKHSPQIDYDGMEDHQQSSTIIDILPDCAIVIGSMNITLPLQKCKNFE